MGWIEVAVSVAPAEAEAAGDCLLRFCPAGLVDGPGARGRRRVLRAYLPATGAGRTALAGLRRLLRKQVPFAQIVSRRVRDEDWARSWRDRARPVCIGRLVVQPPWMPARAPRGRVLVRLDAGQAFGSGEHPSTQLCLAAIERHVRGGETVLDLGTGSGILAIAAARLGAHRVLALDDDGIAVAVARANARANGVGRQVAVRRALGLGQVRLRADLVVANLTPEILVRVLPDVPRCLSPGGRFVGSGFGPARVAGVVARAEAAGLRVVGVEARRGWRAVHAVAGSP